MDKEKAVKTTDSEFFVEEAKKHLVKLLISL
jgi:hypothetical protein